MRGGITKSLRFVQSFKKHYLPRNNKKNESYESVFGFKPRIRGLATWLEILFKIKTEICEDEFEE